MSRNINLGSLVSTTGVAASGTTRVLSCWYYTGGTPGANFQRLIHFGDGNPTSPGSGAATALDCCLNYGDDNGTGKIGFFAGWSGGIGRWSCPAPTSDAWHHILVYYDGSGTASDPIMWVDGVSQTVTRILGPSGTRTGTGPWKVAIGSDAAGAQNFSGYIADVTLWNSVSASTLELTATALGVHPLRVNREGIIFYVPVRGVASPEFEETGTGLLFTVTGTNASDHPPTQAPYGADLVGAMSTGGGGYSTFTRTHTTSAYLAVIGSATRTHTADALLWAAGGAFPTPVETLIGTATTKAPGSAWTAFSSVTLAAGDTLVVFAGDGGNSIVSVMWNGLITTSVGLVHHIYSAAGGTGNIVFNTNGSGTIAAIAYKVTNLCPPLGYYPDTPYVDSVTDAGSGTSVTDSGSTDDYPALYFAVLETAGPSGDTAASWSGGYTGIQRAGTTGGSDYTISVAKQSKLAHATAIAATASGFTSRAWRLLRVGLLLNWRTANKPDTETVVSTTVNPSAFGVSVDITATLNSSVLSGSVEFFDGAVSLGTVPVTYGVDFVVLSTAALAGGARSLTAVYSGNVERNPSTSAAYTQTVTGGGGSPAFAFLNSQARF